MKSTFRLNEIYTATLPEMVPTAAYTPSSLIKRQRLPWNLSGVTVNYPIISLALHVD